MVKRSAVTEDVTSIMHRTATTLVMNAGQADCLAELAPAKSDGYAGSRLGSLTRRVLLLAVFAVTLVGGARLIGVNVEGLTGRIIIDDSLYYIVPAQHLLAGQGYSFDGEKRTNGVQPLWAMIVVLLTAACPNNASILYVVVIVAALFWIGAGVVLYRALRCFNPWIALLVLVGWLMTGFWNRLAFQGMENGIHAFLFAWIIAYGVRYLRLPSEVAKQSDGPAFYWQLGILLGLFALARVDSALLALLMGIVIWLGLVRPGGTGRVKLNWRGAIWLTIPGAILFGGTLFGSWLYFGSAMPLSGYVKQYYQKAWGPLHGGPVEELHWHAKYLWDIATWPVGRHFEHGAVPHRAIAWWSLVLLKWLLAIGTTYGLYRLLRRRGSVLSPPLVVFGVVLAAFVGLHFAIYSIAMSHFTTYGTWYFAAEFLALWIGFGVGLALFGSWVAACLQSLGARVAEPAVVAIVTGTVALLMILAAPRAVWPLPERDARRATFYRSAEWLTANLPPRQKVASFSSGFQAFFAPSHQMINLDGLVNDREYFERYLRPERIEQYLRDREIGYFSDYATQSRWKSGKYWSIDLSTLQLLQWFPISGDLSCGIWKARFDQPPADVLAPCEGPHNRVAQVQFAGRVLGRYPTVGEEGLREALEKGPNLRVVTSIVDPVSRSLTHVLVPAEQLPLGIVEGNCGCEQRAGASFGSTLRLVGYDLPYRMLAQGRRLVISRYWKLEEEVKTKSTFSILLGLRRSDAQSLEGNGGLGELLHVTQPAYGTRSLDTWRQGEVVAETYSLSLSPALKRGHYGLMMAVEDAAGKRLPVAGPQATGRAYYLGDIELE